MRRLREITRFVADVPAAVRFYQDVLQSQPAHSESEIAIFEMSGVTLLLHERYEPGPHDLSPEDHVAFAVDDLEAAVAGMAAQGHRVAEPPRTYPWGRSAYLRDPDGRLVEFHEEKTIPSKPAR